MSEPDPSDSAPADAESTARLRRLHPLTLVIEIPRLVLTWVAPLLLLSIFTSSGEPFYETKAFQFAIISAVIGTLGALARYFTLRFGIQDDQLVIGSGLLQKRSRRIPLEQIHNIDLESRPLQRLLGVTKIKVETAGGAGTEAEFSLVGEGVAKELREEILERQGHARAVSAPEPETVIREVSFRELLIAGATENRVGAIAATLLALQSQLTEAGFDVAAAIEEPINRIVGAGTTSAIVAGVALVALFVVGGWLVSILLTFVRYFGFSLRRTGEGLRRRHGLLTRFEALIKVSRVQVMLSEANPLRRMLGYATLKVQTAGSPRKSDSSGSSVFFPLLPRAEVGSLTSLVFSSLRFDEGELRSVHPLAIRRGFRRFLVAGLLASGAIGVWQGWSWLLGLVPASVIVARWLAIARYRALGYVVTDSFLFSRAGLWTRKLWAVPKERVQTVAIKQNPFQRRLGIANVVIDTAGAQSWSAVKIVDLGIDEARRVFEDLTDAATHADWREAV